jgi:hypothetical protein
MWRRRCVSVPNRSSDGPSTSRPTVLANSGAPAAASSWSTMICSAAGRPAAAAELAGPGAPYVAGGMTAGLPRPQRGHPLVQGARQPGGIRALGRQELAELLLQPALLSACGHSCELRSYQERKTRARSAPLRFTCI